jgi:PKD repeat protein
MGEEQKSSKVTSWFKAILGALTGLLSGALMMYLSPLLEKAIKPAKPVANFSYDADQLTVTFHNRSIGGSQGWWDFGDGSALELISAKQETISHSYATPAEYTAKLTLRNQIGEESERSVTVKLGQVASATPVIETVDVVPISADAYAPATFRVSSRVKNAQLCIWDIGDDRPVEISSDVAGPIEKLVTFKKAGGYVIKLVATNGTLANERSKAVRVNEPPAGTVSAVLTVSEQATRLENREKEYTFGVSFPDEATEPSYRFEKQARADHGYEIVDVRVKTTHGDQPRLGNKPALFIDPALLDHNGGRNLSLKLINNRGAVQLSGELVKETAWNKRQGPPPSALVPVVLVEQRRSQATRPATAVAATLTVPGTATLSMPHVPQGWTNMQRQMRLAIQSGDHVLWQDSLMPQGQPITINGKGYLLTATAAGEQIRIELTPAPSRTGPNTN